MDSTYGLARQESGESIKYADRFAHTTPYGDKELIVALVLTGEAYDCGTSNLECHLTPHNDFESVKFDRVSGITKNTRVYMLYEIYPAYIVNTNVLKLVLFLLCILPSKK